MLFKKTSPFAAWHKFDATPCLAVADRLGLGPGDGISVMFHGREIPMDLSVTHPDCFVVQDPDGQSFVHGWDKAVSYSKRIKLPL